MHLLWYLSPIGSSFIQTFFLEERKKSQYSSNSLRALSICEYSFSILSIIFYVIVIWLELLITYGKQQACIL